MKPDVILISHGFMAQQLHESAKMIMGEIEGMHSLAMQMEDGKEGTRQKLDAKLAEIGPGRQVLLLVDMLSGTPCNVAVEAMYENENLAVLTGMTLAMAIEYAVAPCETPAELAEYLREVGLGGIQHVQKPIINTDDEEGGYED